MHPTRIAVRCEREIDSSIEHVYLVISHKSALKVMEKHETKQNNEDFLCVHISHQLTTHGKCDREKRRKKGEKENYLSRKKRNEHFYVRTSEMDSQIVERHTNRLISISCTLVSSFGRCQSQRLFLLFHSLLTKLLQYIFYAFNYND